MRSILTLLLFLSFFVVAEGVLEVNWPKEATNQQKMKMRSYSSTLQRGIAEVTLPVYMPSFYVYEKDISIVADKNFYTITIFLKGATLMISGDRTYQQKVVSGAKQLKAKMKKVSNRFIHAEGMMTTDFNRHGVNYSLTIECENPQKDKRCKEADFLKNIYNRLIIVGGKR
jgi:hypothetical protein